LSRVSHLRQDPRPTALDNPVPTRGHLTLVSHGSVNVCPAKGRSIGGCESRPGKPPEDPGSQPPAFGEIRTSKRGEAKLQAVTNVNSAASKNRPVRDRAGRAGVCTAKAAVRAVDSGAARNRSGVEEMACSEGWSVNWGGPPAPAVVDGHGSRSWYKRTAKSRAARRESERGTVPLTAETTELGPREGPALR